MLEASYRENLDQALGALAVDLNSVDPGETEVVPISKVTRQTSNLIARQESLGLRLYSVPEIVLAARERRKA